MTNTTVNYEGTSYTLVEEAFLTNHQFRAVYEAPAIKFGEEPGELGMYELYTIRWEIKEGYDLNDYNEEDLCDWENPDEVIEAGTILL